LEANPCLETLMARMIRMRDVYYPKNTDFWETVKFPKGILGGGDCP